MKAQPFVNQSCRHLLTCILFPRVMAAPVRLPSLAWDQDHALCIQGRPYKADPSLPRSKFSPSPPRMLPKLQRQGNPSPNRHVVVVARAAPRFRRE